jgi:general secretion pathway protein K
MSEKMTLHELSGCRQNARNVETGRDGFIIVAVLWILGALSVLASVYATYVISTAAGVRHYDETLQSEALVSAALELTAYRELSTSTKYRPTHGTFSFELGGAAVSVKYYSEASRIDLNVAPKELLAGLFRTLGAASDAANVYADRVIEWRTPPRVKSGASGFEGQALSYPLRGAKFPHPSELARVRDLPPELVRRALPFVTVYSGVAKIDITDAAPQVIAALPGMNRDRLNAILTARRADALDGKSLKLLLGPAQAFATTKPGRTFRVTVHVNFHDGRRTNTQAVILLFAAGKEPFSLLSWRDSAYGSGLIQ